MVYRHLFFGLDGKDGASRFYLQQVPEIRAHDIWRQESFWRDALLEGVRGQRAKYPDNVMIPWDEMSVEALREAVVGKCSAGPCWVG